MIKYFIALLICIPATSFAHESNEPPQLWSWFKNLNKSVEACVIQSKFKFGDIGVQNIVEKRSNIYGVYRGNRVVAKCLENGEKTRLWIMVAGYDADSVELIRNRLIEDII